jgi:hypothetical protein
VHGTGEEYLQTYAMSSNDSSTKIMKKLILLSLPSKYFLTDRVIAFIHHILPVACCLPFKHNRPAISLKHNWSKSVGLNLY